MDLVCSISYGVDFGETPSLPWGHDLEAWWLLGKGGEPPPDVSYRENSNIWKEYYQYRRDFLKRIPLPIEELHFGFEGRSLALVVPGLTVQGGDWDPLMFDPEFLKISPEAVADYVFFFESNSIVLPSRPSWLVMGCYG